MTGTVLSKSYLDYKKKKETLIMFSFWLITWTGILLFALYPSLFFTIGDKVKSQGIGYGTMLGLIFMFLFFVTYRVYVKAHRLERQLRDLVMKMGLKDIEKE
jgi:hypothetical protein